MNPMKEAWKLLKGNPAMRDAQGKAINHPVVMNYDSLAFNVARDLRGREGQPFHEDPRPTMGEMDDESVADDIESWRKPTHQMRIRRELERGGNPTYANLKVAQHWDKWNKERLNDYRQHAKDQTSRIMAHGDDERRFPPQLFNDSVERQ